MPETHPLQPGDPQSLGNYRLLGRLGKGAQGIVFKGEAPDGRLVAIKLLNTRLDKPGLDGERFMREVAAARRVAQFCTAQVLGANMDGEQAYIVSELVDGVSLQVVVQREGPRTGGALYRLAVGTVTALAAIHRAGIVHRDFKPSNVLIGSDGPRVIDFGIARALDSAMTISSGVVGTPAYMSPEQISAERVGPASDMFSWALTMVFAATGRPAFGQDSLPAVIYRVMNEEPDLSALPDDLRPIVQSCLNKRAEERPTAADVLFALLENQGAAPRLDDEVALTTGSQLAAEQPPSPTPGLSAASGPPASGWASPGGSPAAAVPSGSPAERSSGTGAHAAGPQGSGPQAAGPQVSGPQVSGQHAAGPYGAGPRDSGPHASRPHASGPHGVGPHGSGGQAAGGGGVASGVGWAPPGVQQPVGGAGWVSPEGPAPAGHAASGWANPSGDAYAGPPAPPANAGYPAGGPRASSQQPPAPYTPLSPQAAAPFTPAAQQVPGAQQQEPASGRSAGSFVPPQPPPGGQYRPPYPMNAAPNPHAPGQGQDGPRRSKKGEPPRGDNDAFFENVEAGERSDTAKARRRRAAMVAGALAVALVLAGGVLYFSPKMFGSTSDPGGKTLTQATTSFTPTPPPTPTITSTPTPTVVTTTPAPAQTEQQTTVPVVGKQDGKSLKGHTKGVQTFSAVSVGDETTWLVTGGQDGRVRLWDLAEHKSLATMKGHSQEVYAVAGAMMGKTPVAVSGGYDGSVRLWNLKTRKGKILGWHGQSVFAAAVTKVKGKWVAVTGDADGYLRFWDLDKRKAMGKSIRAHRKPVNWLSATHIGDRAIAISASGDESLRMWDMSKRKAYGKAYKGHSKGVYAVTVGKVGGKTVVASGGKDGKIRIWDPKNGKTLGTMSGHKKNIYALSFGTMGDRTVLLSGSTDGTIRLWDPDTRKALGKPVKAHKSGVYAVGIVSVGDRVAVVSAGEDKLVRMWKAEDAASGS
ncbi:serine/threonine-protein kinase [Nonomuraea sp. SYSU D8015]|uniref:serine/threonine-protein kinase n=1 Tax=Nonomuraea sp. SYSU D8015 TaxID=2593644 RepID=UPI001660FEE3|nr:serine/threonine-protein kinase [Nonomuraea sp. SYSU D8015]